MLEREHERGGRVGRQQADRDRLTREEEQETRKVREEQEARELCLMDTFKECA